MATPTSILNVMALSTHEMNLKDMDASLLSLAIKDYQLSYPEGLDRGHVEAALYAASVWHSKQVRNARGHFKNTPYVEHPLRNALRLLRAGVRDATTIITCLLHDSLEDTRNEIMATGQGVGIDSDSPEEVVSQLFGDSVAELVWAVTNDPKPEGGLSDEEKRKVYATKVDSLVRGMVATGDPRAFLVKLSDLVDNASSLRAAWEIAPEDEKPCFLKRFAKYAEAMPSVALGVVQLADLVPEHVHMNLQAATHRMLRNLWVLASNTDAEEAQAALREARKVLSDC